MKQHKWHKEIKAWADGAEIEVKNEGGVWLKCAPLWETSKEYRIKPQPVEPQYLYVWEGEIGHAPMITFTKEEIRYAKLYRGKIPLIMENDDD